MSRLAAAMLVLCAPAWAAPSAAHRQPTPETVRSGTEGVPAGRAGATTDPGKPTMGTGDSDVRSRDWDRKVKKSMGGVCRGC